MKRLLPSACVLLAIALPSDADTHFGRYELTPIQDTPKAMSLKLFPQISEQEFIRLAGSAEAPASINTFLLRGEGKLILVDAGNGGNIGRTAARLHELGIDPEQIDAVIITHMHGDHIGGLIQANGQATFPRADIYVSAPEQAYWEKEAGPGGKLAKRVLAAYSNRVKELRCNDEPLPGIRAIAAPGHTPGHMILEVGNLYLIADLLHAAAIQVPHPDICATYDQNSSQAAETRRKVFDMASAPGKIVAGAHLPYPGIGRITRKDEGYTYTPAPAEQK